jgi:hypothetical protein
MDNFTCLRKDGENSVPVYARGVRIGVIARGRSGGGKAEEGERACVVGVVTPPSRNPRALPRVFERTRLELLRALMRMMELNLTFYKVSPSADHEIGDRDLVGVGWDERWGKLNCPETTSALSVAYSTAKSTCLHVPMTKRMSSPGISSA